jgi:predicted HAD superfamily Cof-like phosphohydrolase
MKSLEEKSRKTKMNAITKFYGKHEVDISESVKAMVIESASGTSFSRQEIIDALSAANPSDEDCSDERQLTHQVKGALNMFSNRMSPASMYICEELGNGQFVRK